MATSLKGVARFWRAPLWEVSTPRWLARMGAMNRYRRLSNRHTEVDWEVGGRSVAPDLNLLYRRLPIGSVFAVAARPPG